jgi:fructosamine-3-kinase
MITEWMRVELEPFTGAIERLQPVGGGCIANAAQIVAEGGSFFLKHAGDEPGDTFEAEAEGLDLLREAAEGCGIGVPLALHARNRGARPGVLLLEWISPGVESEGYWRRFGRALATLHRKSAPGGGAYGLDHDNFIGRRPQHNGWLDDWATFFRDRRLAPQIALARRSPHWATKWEPMVERLLARVDSLLPRRPHPSVLHGDLWGGNQLAGADGRPWLVDPADYVGDREADLAMTELFGGFGRGFYDAYRSAWPLEPGYEERREFYNLYHLCNHLLHFGGAAYASGFERTLARFGR